MKLNINPKPLSPVIIKLADEVLKLNILRIKAIKPINNKKLIMLIICIVVDGIIIIFDKAYITSPSTAAIPIKYETILEISAVYGPICCTSRVPPDKLYTTNINMTTPIIINPSSDKLAYVVKNSKLFL